MLGDDPGDGTMPPTERRRRQARERGEVARSSQLTSAIVLFAVSCLFWTMTPQSANPLVSLMRQGLTTAPQSSITINSANELLYNATRGFATVIGPVALVLLISGLAANLTQVGWLWVPVAVLPRFRRESLFSWDRLADALGLLLRFGLLGFVAWRFMISHDRQLHSFGMNEPALMLAQIFRLVAELCLQLSVALVLLAFVDYGYRFWRHEQSLMMTVEERRREQREDSVDPRIKRQRSADTSLRVPSISNDRS